MKNTNPLFAMAPAEVLLKAKTLAAEFYAEQRLKDLVGRHMFLVALVIVVLLALNALNAWNFATNARSVFPATSGWAKAAIDGGAGLIALGGMLMSFNAFVAWLEVLAMRGAEHSFAVRPRNQRLYRRRTWLPLIPLVVLPTLFNMFFSTATFFAVVLASLAIPVFYVLRDDA